MNRDSRHEVVFAFPKGSFFTACNHKGERILALSLPNLASYFQKTPSWKVFLEVCPPLPVSSFLLSWLEGRRAEER
jgi:hypothetical protein